MKKLKITQCNDGMMWYAKLVGQLVPYHGKWEGEGYKSVDNGGYTNIVKFEDATIEEVTK